MNQLMQQLAAVATTDANVLLTGENGTGKSQLAHWLHLNSPRAQQAFISVNMGAIPETLFESEIFGHKKGAFTDAKEQRIGRFELAKGGSLFLDEIAELNLKMTFAYCFKRDIWTKKSRFESGFFVFERYGLKAT